MSFRFLVRKIQLLTQITPIKFVYCNLLLHLQIIQTQNHRDAVFYYDLYAPKPILSFSSEQASFPAMVRLVD